jgi:hypothetical protein
MKIKELFDSQARESSRLVHELEQHESTHGVMMVEYNRIDGECIVLAAQLNAEMAARSPKAGVTALELRSLRWRRDGPKHDHARKREDLQRQNETLTTPEIRPFCEECLNRVKRLIDARHVEREENYYTPEGTRRIRVRHNLAALNRSKDAILAAMSFVRSMQCHSLTEIREAILRYQAEFNGLDFNTLEVEDMSPDAARDLEARQEPLKTETAYRAGNVLVGEAGKLDSHSQAKELNDKFQTLKAQLGRA